MIKETQKDIDYCEEKAVHSNAVQKTKSNMPDDDLLYEVADLFKVFGDSTRTRIIAALFENELCVCDLAELLNMTISAISHQLRVLRQTKIVKSRRSGKEIFYSLDDEHIYRIYQMAIEHIKE